VTPDVAHVFCDTALGNTINRSVSVLLQQVSQRAHATLVALIATTASDGSILIRPTSTSRRGPRSRSYRRRCVPVSRLRGRLVEFGVRLETHGDSPSALLVVPGPLVSVG
jgi:hypothetical protein